MNEQLQAMVDTQRNISRHMKKHAKTRYAWFPVFNYNRTKIAWFENVTYINCYYYKLYMDNSFKFPRYRFASTHDLKEVKVATTYFFDTDDFNQVENFIRKEYIG